MLSICLIAKNETAYLPRLIDSIRGEFDELVILDTGSTADAFEQYRQYQAEFGARLVFDTYAWKHDFADARNQAVQRSTQAWYLWMDADMYVEPGMLTQLTALIQTLPPSIDGVGVKVIDGQNALNSVRVCRRGCRFVGKVHENPQVNQSVQTPFVIHHQRDEPDRRDKDAYYEQILRDELREDPRSLHALSYLRDIALGRNDQSNLRQYCERILAIQSDEYLSHLHLARLAAEAKYWDTAFNHALLALKQGGLDPRVYLLIAELFDEQGRKIEAMAFYRHILGFGPEAKILSSRYALESDLYDVIPYANMAKIYLDVGKRAEAIEYYRKALASNPNTPHKATLQRNLAVAESQ